MVGLLGKAEEEGREKDDSLKQLKEELNATKVLLLPPPPPATIQESLVEAMGDVESKMGSIGKTREELHDVQVQRGM